MWRCFDNATHWLAGYAAQAYTAPTLERAREICLALQERGFTCSVCFWNDDLDSVDKIKRSSLQLLDLVRHLEPQAYLSLKLPALQFDVEAVTCIVQAASRMPRLIHFDSHGPEHAGRMFDTIKNALTLNRRLGCTIPGRWLRSRADASIAAGWGLRVRVVKGQWADPRDPKMDPRRGFLDVVDTLHGNASGVAVATHDTALAREALSRLLTSGTPCELELLHGLPHRAAVQLARKLNVGIRFYIPQGKAWLPYVLKQGRRHPQVLGWFARDLIRACAGERGTPARLEGRQ